MTRSALEARRRLMRAAEARRSSEPRLDAVISPVVLRPAEFPRLPLVGYLASLLGVGKRVRETIEHHVVPELPGLVAARAAAARRDSASMAPSMRVAVVGGPKAGKTTLALGIAWKLGGLRVRHADDLIGVGWSDASALLADEMLSGASGIFEGVAIVRALRKALALSGRAPVDALVILPDAHEPLTDAQRAMWLAQGSILAEILPELERRGVRLVRPLDAGALEYVSALVQAPALPRLDAADPLEAAFARARAALRYDVRADIVRAGLRTLDYGRAELERQIAAAFRVPTYTLQPEQLRRDAGFEPLATINPFDHAAGIGEHLDKFVREQTKRVSDMTDATYSAAQATVRHGLEQGLRPDALAAKLLQTVDGISQTQAVIIANDAIGKFHGETTKIRQEALGITEYDWHTAGDVKVRPGHRALEGTRQKWSSPPIVNPKTGKRAHPGFDTHFYACRCVALPVIDPDTIEPPADSPYSRPTPAARPLQPSLPGLPPRPITPPIRTTPPTAPGLPPPAPPRTPTSRAAEAVGVPAPQPSSGRPLGPPTETPPYVITRATTPPSSGPIIDLTVRIPRPAPPDLPSSRPARIPDRKRLADDLTRAAEDIGLGVAKGPIEGGLLRNPVQGMLDDLGYPRIGRAATATSGRVRTFEANAADAASGIQATRNEHTGALRLAGDTAVELTHAVEALSLGQVPTDVELQALHTLVHEEMKAYGPALEFHGTTGARALLTDITTEVASRDVTAELAGLPQHLRDRHPLALPAYRGKPGDLRGSFSVVRSRPFDALLAATQHALRDVTEWSPGQVADALVEASSAWKRTALTFTSEDAARDYFAGLVPGLDEAQRAAFAAQLADREALLARHHYDLFASTGPRKP